MAKTDNAGAAGAPTTESAPASEVAGYSNERLAKMAKGTTVRVFERDKNGDFIVDEETGLKRVIQRAITAEDIHAHHVRGDQVTIVTVDGQKIIAAAA